MLVPIRLNNCSVLLAITQPSCVMNLISRITTYCNSSLAIHRFSCAIQAHLLNWIGIKPFYVLMILALGGCTSAIDDKPRAARYQKGLSMQAMHTPQLPMLAEFEHLSRALLPLSRGDKVKITLVDGELFTGIYQVDLDGALHLPFLEPVYVTGVSARRAKQLLKEQFLQQELFQAETLSLSIELLLWSEIKVSVTGAVFSPGLVAVNQRNERERELQLTHNSGDLTFGRYLTSALKAAGGIRPDADLKNIILMRDSKQLSFDLSGVFSGINVPDIPLVAGDKVLVPSLGRVQASLLRPSSITPPGFQLFMSNLTQPAESNAASGLPRASYSVPYGTRLLRALLRANCVGGAQSSSGSRSVLHITTERQTGQVIVGQYQIDEVINNANSLNFNPFLMPDDGLACYDSGMTNIREIANIFSDIFQPLVLLRLLTVGS